MIGACTMVAPAARAASTRRRVFSSMPVLSITPWTAVEDTALRGEVVLVLDQNDSGALRIERHGGLLARSAGRPAPDVSALASASARHLSARLRALTFVVPLAAQPAPLALKAIITV